MMRTSRIVLVVGLCACVGVAFGAATKITSFTNFFPESDQADGMAILRHVSGQDNTSAQVILSDLEASTPYVVILREPNTWSLDGGDVEFGPVTKPPLAGNLFFAISALNLETNSRGHLTFHASTTAGSGDVSDYDVLIFAQADWPPTPSPTTEGDFLPAPVRLIGYNGTPAP